MHHTVEEMERICKRSEAIAELLKRMNLSHRHVPPTATKDLDRDARHMWECILHLPNGALSWHRFSGQFSGWSSKEIAYHWTREQLEYCLIGQNSTIVRMDETVHYSINDLILGTLEYVEVNPEATIWLTGSADVSQELKRLGLVVPKISRKPRGIHWEAFEVVVICRGPATHGDFNPWTLPFDRQPMKPVKVQSGSSNISGIAQDFYSERNLLLRSLRKKRAS